MAFLPLMAWQGVDGMRARDVEPGAARADAAPEDRARAMGAGPRVAAGTTARAGPRVRRPTLRLTRRTEGGLQVVVWSLRPTATACVLAALGRTSGDDHAATLQEQLAAHPAVPGSEPGQLRALDGAQQWQIYFYRGNAWPTASRAATCAAGAGRRRATGTSRRCARRCRTACALVLTFAPGSGLNGTLTRDPLRQRHERPPRCAADRRAHAQRGAALLTAMIIVALVATLAGGDGLAAVARGPGRGGRAGAHAVGLDPRRRARLGAADPARGRAGTGGADHLGEPWAVPLAEARLSTFLAADKDNTEEAPDAFLSGPITDAQARYNLRNLVERRQDRPSRARTLQSLCETAGVSADSPSASRPACAMPAAGAARPERERRQRGRGHAAAANPPLMPRTVAQLAWLGIDPSAVRRARPYVMMLPERTTSTSTPPRAR